MHKHPRPRSVGLSRLLNEQPEWTSFYFDYEQLKRAIKPGKPSEPISQENFEKLIYDNLKKTELFFISRSLNLQVRTNALNEFSRTIKSASDLAVCQNAIAEILPSVFDLTRFSALNQAILEETFHKPGCRPPPNQYHTFMISAPGNWFLGPLHKRIEVIEISLKDFNPSPVDSKLQELLRSDDSAGLKQLLDLDPLINKNTLLLHACIVGSKLCVETILQLGADVDVVDRVTNLTPLLIASKSNRHELVRVLLQAKASTDLSDLHGRVALHHAAINGDFETFKQLCEAGAALVQDAYGLSPLFYAAVNGRTAICLQYIDSRSAQQLSRYDADFPVLNAICRRGHVSILKVLLQFISLLQVDKHGLTALHAAAKANQISIIETLLAHVDGHLILNRQEPQRFRSPLIVAAMYGHLEIVQLLVKAGVEINASDAVGWTASDHALYHGHLETYKYLSSVSKELSPQRPLLLTHLNQAPSLPRSPALAKGERVLFLTLGGFVANSSKPAVTFLDNDINPNYIFIRVFLNEPRPIGGHGLIFPITRVPAHDMIFKLPTKDLNIAVHILPFTSREFEPLACATILTDSLPRSFGSIDVPLMAQQRHVATAHFDYLLIDSFDDATHANHQAQSWPSTKLIGHRGSGADRAAKTSEGFHRTHFRENTIVSFNEAGRYVNFVEFDVHVTRDHVPVVFHDFRFNKEHNELPVSELNTDLLQHHNQKKRARRSSLPNQPAQDFTVIEEPIPTLEQTFQNVASHIGFNVEVKFPNDVEVSDEKLPEIGDLNTFVDDILRCVFAHAGNRPVIFSSFFPQICLLLQWKQSRYPVLFLTDAGWDPRYSDQRSLSLHHAISFCRRNNLAGIVSNVAPLLAAPSLFFAVKYQGLKLLTYGRSNNQPEIVLAQLEQYAVDAVIADHVGYLTRNLSGN